MCKLSKGRLIKTIPCSWCKYITFICSQRYSLDVNYKDNDTFWSAKVVKNKSDYAITKVLFASGEEEKLYEYMNKLPRVGVPPPAPLTISPRERRVVGVPPPAPLTISPRERRVVGVPPPAPLTISPRERRVVGVPPPAPLTISPRERRVVGVPPPAPLTISPRERRVVGVPPPAPLTISPRERRVVGVPPPAPLTISPRERRVVGVPPPAPLTISPRERRVVGGWWECPKIKHTDTSVSCSPLWSECSGLMLSSNTFFFSGDLSGTHRC